MHRCAGALLRSVMPIKYVAYTEDGQRVSGLLDVDSTADAEEKLWGSNLIVVQLKRVRRLPSKYELLPTLFRVKTSELISFARDLSFLLESGIPLFRSLHLLLPRIYNRRLRVTLEGVIQNIASGNSLSQSLAKYPDIFPTIFTRLVRVGEETGGLAEVLHRVITYMERQEDLARKVKKATTYPAMVFVVGIAGAVVLVTFAMPQLTTLFTEFGAEIPTAARMLIALSGWLENNGMYVLAGMAVAGIAFWRYVSTARGRRKWDYYVLRIPRVGMIVSSSNLARFTSTLEVLLTAGVPLVEAVSLLRVVSTNIAFIDASGQIETDLLTGQSFSESLSKYPVFPNMTVQMINVAEEGGGLSTSLERQSRFYEEETDRAIASTTSLIEPLAIIVVAILVGFVAISMFTAIYSLIGQIQ